MQNQINSWGPISALMSSFTWALGTTYYSKFAKDHAPYAINFSRALFSLPLFVLMAAFLGSNFAVVRQEHVFWLFVSLSGSYALGDSIFLLAAKKIGSSAALTIGSLYPVFSAIFAYFVWSEVLSPLNLLGMLLALIGVILVIQSKRRAHTESHHAARSEFVIGFALAFVTAGLWTVNSLGVAHVGRELPSEILNSIRMSMALILCPLVPYLGGGLKKVNPFLPGSLYKSFFWVFMAEGFFGATCFVYGLSHSSVAIGSTLSSLAPVLVIPAAWLISGERPTKWGTLGTLLALAGVLLVLQK